MASWIRAHRLEVCWGGFWKVTPSFLDERSSSDCGWGGIPWCSYLAAAPYCWSCFPRETGSLAACRSEELKRRKKTQFKYDTRQTNKTSHWRRRGVRIKDCPNFILLFHNMFTSPTASHWFVSIQANSTDRCSLRPPIQNTQTLYLLFADTLLSSVSTLVFIHLTYFQS